MTSFFKGEEEPPAGLKDDPFELMRGQEVELEEHQQRDEEKGAAAMEDHPFRILGEMFPNLEVEVLQDIWDSSMGDVDACINAALLVSSTGGADPCKAKCRGGGERRRFRMRKLHGQGGDNGCSANNHHHSTRSSKNNLVLETLEGSKRAAWDSENDGGSLLYSNRPLSCSSSSSSESEASTTGQQSESMAMSAESACIPAEEEEGKPDKLPPPPPSPSSESVPGEGGAESVVGHSRCEEESAPPQHPGVTKRGNPIMLPDSFLRLPQQCIAQARGRFPEKSYTIRHSYSVRLSKTKGVRGGLGVTVEENRGKVVVKALPRDSWDEPNQAERAGMRIGDVLEGIDSQDFSGQAVALDKLIHLVRSLPEEVTLHMARVDHIAATSPANTSSPYDAGEEGAPLGPPRQQSLIPTSYHRLAQILLDEGVADHEQAFSLTKMMMQIQYRNKMWEADSFVSLVYAAKASPRRVVVRKRSDSGDNIKRPFLSGIGGNDRHRSSPNSSHHRRRGGLASSSTTDDDAHHSPPPPPPVDPTLLISTRDLRRAMTVRIVSTDFVEDHTVYVMDVCDVETGSQWKVRRRFREFFELQEKCVALRPSVATLDFPMRRPTLTESISVVHTRKVMLTKYMRRLAGLLFYAPLHRSSCAILKLLQDFLDVPSRIEALRILEKARADGRQGLMASLEIATHRVLNIPVMDRILTDFTDHIAAARAEEDLFGLASYAGGAGSMKGQEMLEKLRRFMDHLQTCLMDGIGDELRPMVKARHPDMPPDEVDALVSAAIRRQVESHVYTPVMAKLIESLRRDDAETKYEARVRDNIQAAKDKPQVYFGIPPHQVSPTGWRHAVHRFNGVVEHSLPCDKLSSLVEAAKEIPLIYKEEHPHAEKPLGADEFLPIFIYVVSQSAIEDLYLVKDVLCHLCDPNKRLSEVGYYLASFEASVEHLRDLNSDAAVTASLTAE